MKIAFFGEDSFSLVVLSSLVNAGHSVAIVISPEYDNSNHLKLEKYTVSHKIEYYRFKNINSEQVYEKVRIVKPDLIVVAHFEKLLKKELIRIPKFGCINLHPSRLPYYRGMSPQHWPIINGEGKTAVTVHFIDEGIDTGDIIIQKDLIIEDHIYVSDLQFKMRDIYKEIVVEAIEIIKNKGPYIKQKEEVGSYYGKLKRADTIIKDNMTTFEAYRLIRGVSRPYLGAIYNDLLIWKATMAKDLNINKRGLFTIGNKKYLGLVDGCLELTDYEMFNNL